MSDPSRRPKIMGVVNVTPDSFSDGGRFFDADTACAHGLSLAAAGADWLDVGGESTRPGAEPVGEQEELDRVIPVIEALRARSQAAISIDTMKPAVAEAAVSAGATLWNDVAALREPGAIETAARLGVPVVLMHMQGEPRTMQAAPAYDDVVADVIAFLSRRIAAAVEGGVARRMLMVDPGVGFGKSLEHNLALLAATRRIVRETEADVLIGVSRKRFIQALDPSATDAGDRLGGSLAAALFAAREGAGILRVHDVRETAQALAVQTALERAHLAASSNIA